MSQKYTRPAKEYFRDRIRRIKQERPEHILFLTAKSRAKVNNIPFDIEESDIVIPEKCPILGIDLKVAKAQRTDNSPSLDRYDPELGYIKGNVWVISWRANNLKRDASKEELIKFATWILREPDVPEKK